MQRERKNERKRDWNKERLGTSESEKRERERVR